MTRARGRKAIARAALVGFVMSLSSDNLLTCSPDFSHGLAVWLTQSKQLFRALSAEEQRDAEQEGRNLFILQGKWHKPAPIKECTSAKQQPGARKQAGLAHTANQFRIREMEKVHLIPFLPR